MTTYYRRLLIAPAAWRNARQELAAVASERDQLRHELVEIKRDRDRLLCALNELRAAHCAVETTRAELVSLYRERELRRARIATRDPALPLQ